MKKRILKIFLIILAFLLVLVAFAYFFLNPYKGSVLDWKKQNVKLQQVLTKKQATDDLHFIEDKISALHYSARNGLPAAFKKQYEQEIVSLSDHPTILQVWQAGSRMLHTLDDGHSAIYGYIDERSYSDADYSFINNDVYITIGGQSYRVTKICGTDIDLLKRNASLQLSYENEIYRDYQFLFYLKTDAKLEWLGCPSFSQYTVEYCKNEKTQAIVISPDTLSENAAPEKWVSYRIDKADNIGILTLNKCKDNDEYKKSLYDFFTEVKKSGVTNVAIDLRENGGGSSYVLNDFIRYLNVDRYQDYTSYHRLKLISFKDPGSTTVKNSKIHDLLFNGKVYVLTSPETFSSAMNFSVVLQDNKLAQVIGEPSGNKPCQYGEVVTFLLPNSKMYFCTTFAYFERPDKSKIQEAYQVPDYDTSLDKAIDKLFEITREK